MEVVKVTDWLSKFGDDELIEMQGKPVLDQLSFYDESGTGVGFIIYLVPMVEDTGEDEQDPVVEYHLKSQPIVKMRGDWYTVNDYNLADILSAVIRMLK